MKRNGFATMIVLIIGFACMTTAIFALETIVVQSSLVGNRHDNIQAELTLEKEIMDLIYNSEDLLDQIKEAVCEPGNPNLMKINIPFETEEMDGEGGEIIFGYCDEERLIYNMSISGNRNGVLDHITATGHIFNPIIDHCNDGLVCMEGKSLEEWDAVSVLVEDMKLSFNSDLVPSDFFLASNFLENHVIIKAKSSGYRNIELVRENSSTRYKFWNGRIVLFKRFDGFNRDLVRIEKDSSSLISGSVTGVIYLENGDIIMSDDVIFNGVIILGNGRLLKEGNLDSYVNGKVIVNSHYKPDQGVNIVYHPEKVRQMSSFLPGFISPTIDSIR